MKSKKKQSETEKTADNKRLLYVAVAIIAISILATGLFLRIYSNSPGQPKAAIIDQLSSLQLSEISRHENQTFINRTRELLSERFSAVDYYKENATIEQYRNLASRGYKLIVWRAHSALDETYKYVAISGSETNNTSKYDEYSDETVTLCKITGDPNFYYAITPKFVEELIGGSFEDTVVIFMSCNGLKEGYNKTAEAFIQKGVKAFISWDDWIDASDNDHAIALLLDYLITQNNTISEAVSKIPIYNSTQYGSSSELLYCPTDSEVADYRIPDYRQNNIQASGAFVAVSILRKKSAL
jgi:hypothetical protein